MCVTISMIVATPRPSSPSRPRGRAAELDLARRERAGAELVLQPLQLEAGAALDDEAGEPARRLGQDEEHGAHRVRAEPLVAGQLVVPSPAGSARVVPARTSEPPCFSVIAIPHSAPRS